MAGDFNTTIWGLLSGEWLQGGGTVELLDTEVPTFAAGTSVGKFLLTPGFYIPSTFLPPGDGECERMVDVSDTPYYPAALAECPPKGGHAPIVPPISCDTEEVSWPQRRLLVRHLGAGTWIGRNTQEREQLEGAWPRDVLTRPLANVPRY